MNKIKHFFFLFSLGLVLLELGLLVVSYFGFLKIETPTYSFSRNDAFWQDLDVNFGTRHPYNQEIRLKKSCFDISLRSNSYGFRDRERSKKSNSKRVVVLGDSFIEGYGVEENERLTNLLENKSGLEHLNFGMSGNFGTTQYWLSYKYLASSFDHDAVIIGLLPSNDFIDDDFDMGSKGLSNRYRPYLVGEYPNYSVKYFVDDINKASVNDKKSVIKVFLKNFTYTYNAYLYSKTLLLYLKALASDNSSEILARNELPGYSNFTTNQLNRVNYALEEIRQLAGKKPIIVVCIPNQLEIEETKVESVPNLGKELASICQSLKIEFVDLLDRQTKLQPEEVENLFLSCDGHWSAEGNRFAAAAVWENFSFYSAKTFSDSTDLAGY